MEPQKACIATVILRKKDKVGGITVCNIKLYYKATVMQTTWNWHKKSRRHRRNKTERPEGKPRHHDQLILERGSKHILWANDSLFNNSLGKLDIMCKNKIKLDHLLIPYIRINSKWIRGLNIRLEPIKNLEENIGSGISDFSLSNFFF